MSRRSRRTRLAISRKVKLYWAQHGFCSHCQGKMPPPGARCDDPKQAPTLDHCVPKSANGPDDFTNFTLMHMRCNAQKGDRMPTVKHLIILEYVVERIEALHAELRNGNMDAPIVREVYSRNGAIIYDFKAEREMRQDAAKPKRRRKRMPRMKGPHFTRCAAGA